MYLRHAHRGPQTDALAWEAGCLKKGVDRYYGTLQQAKQDGRIVRRSLADLDPGRRIIAEIVAASVPAIAAEQARVKACLEDQEGLQRWTEWWLPFLSLDAPEIAFIATRASLVAAESLRSASLRSIAREVGTHIRMQHDYEAWRQAENARERAVKQQKESGEISSDEYQPNWWKLWYDMSHDHSAKTIRKWKEKSDLYSKSYWSYETRVKLGAKVLGIVYVNSGGWFELQKKWSGKKRFEYWIRLSDEAREWITARHELNSELRPFKLPVLACPTAWGKS